MEALGVRQQWRPLFSHIELLYRIKPNGLSDVQLDGFKVGIVAVASVGYRDARIFRGNKLAAKANWANKLGGSLVTSLERV